MNTLQSTKFIIPEKLNATVPPEIRGNSRSDVNLLVLDRGSENSHHSHFQNIGSFLEEGDLLVFNNSRTIPAVLRGKIKRSREVEIRLSRKLSSHKWEALIVDQKLPIGTWIKFADGVRAVLTGYHETQPLVYLEFSIEDEYFLEFLYKHGEPIRYEYIHSSLPLDYYQTAYGTVPGSVEMCSAGRAFTWQLLKELKEKGVRISFIQLHAGLSYYGNDTWPDPSDHPEWFQVSEQAAQLINETKLKNHRVIAVGTTVVRTLETVAENGMVVQGSGLTNLYINRSKQLQIVDGLLTGFHEPEASHLDLLTAFISEERLMESYQKALEHHYLWHEFGDMNLILPFK